jgi:hypothetical protein
MNYQSGPEEPKRIDELSPRAPLATDFIPICPANGPTYKASLKEIADLTPSPIPPIGPGNVGQILSVGGGLSPEWVTASAGGGGGTVLPDGDAINSCLVWHVPTGAWVPARLVQEAQHIHSGGVGTIPYQIGEHKTAHLNIGTKGQILTVEQLAPTMFLPKWADAAAGLPASSIADASKVLSVTADGTGAEWVQRYLPSGLTVRDKSHLDSLSQLQFVGGLFNHNNLAGVTEITYNSLQSVQSRFWVQNMPDLVEINTPALNYTYASYEVTNCQKLVKINSPSLNVADQGVRIGNCSQLEHISFESFRCVRVGGQTIDNCALLKSVSFPVFEGVFASAFALSFLNCPMLSSIYIGRNSLRNIGGKALNATGLALPAENVNYLLAQVVNLDGTIGKQNFSGAGFSVNISGGTTAAPTGQGITDKNTLVARGCTVTLNP